MKFNLFYLLLLALPSLSGCSFPSNQIALDDGMFAKINQFRAAAEQGDAEAQFQLGTEYYLVHRSCKKTGTFGPIDETEGVKWFRKAAEQGHAEAQYWLGICYSHGNVIPEDKAEGVKWYRKAAEQLHRGAMNSLGVAYQYGLGVPEDKVEAVRWYRKAAEQGCENAMRLLGSCYFDGDGVPKDKEEAVKWFRKSAEQGCCIGKYLLANCYYDGVGIEQDRAEAVRLFLEAYSWHGARFALVRCYLDGEYSPDEEMLEEWLHALRWAVKHEHDKEWEWLKKYFEQATELLREMEKKRQNNPDVLWHGINWCFSSSFPLPLGEG